MRIFGVILAGGAGRRMGGRDKPMLPLAGQPLIAHVIARLSPQVAELAIAGRPAHRVFGLPILPDRQEDRLGPLAGVLAGLDWAAGRGASHLATVPADTPFLPGDLVPRLFGAAEAAQARTAIAVTASGNHPTCALWPVAAGERIAALLAGGERRLSVAAEKAGRAAFDREEAFFNINTPADLARAEALIAAG